MKRRSINAIIGLLSLAALVGCTPNEEKKQEVATIENVYSVNPGSKGSLVYTDMRPAYNYVTCVKNVQTITTYSDKSYMLEEQSTNLSGWGDVISGAAKEPNDRGTTYTYYYGTFTETKEEDTVTLKLSEPTRFAAKGLSYAKGTSVLAINQYVDTANWKDEYKTLLEPWATANNIEGDVDATKLLNQYKFSEKEVFVESNTFDYIDKAAK